ncbi:MAG TPA: class I mannose-6-phosphate isomerase [Clostridia bacterium]|nr:class I mannose-6-phosphate isomerase [Clostridia bacterium]
MLQPIVLIPAWRHGEMTPWGGEALKTHFGKDAPGPRAGESLELSSIPGLESRDAQGRTLSELIALYGQALTGARVGSPLPLLLKLIDAREQLSVQVHPGDGYAQLHHGKLGKNEAWVVLQTAPGAQMILGLRKGTTKDALRAASLKGREVEGLLRSVEVHPGDVFYIPEGTVHAIGAGIVLYEVQQSSDITYRLYDWGRVDKHGRSRQLHLEDSLAVVNLAAQPVPAQASVISQREDGLHERLLDTPFFRLDRLSGCDKFACLPDPARCSVLTALSPMTLAWEAQSLQLSAGQSALLPAMGYPLRLSGKSALIAFPATD